MIKANELRVGNYVYYEDDKHFYDIRALCRDRVHPINIVEHDGNIRYAIDCSLDDLKPIPITAKILKSCGFKYGKTKGMSSFDEYAHTNEGYTYYWDLSIEGNEVFDSFSFSLVKWGEQKYFTFSYQLLRRRLIHLHQLQNLYFALTGDELKFKNA